MYILDKFKYNFPLLRLHACECMQQQHEALKGKIDLLRILVSRVYAAGSNPDSKEESLHKCMHAFIERMRACMHACMHVCIHACRRMLGFSRYISNAASEVFHYVHRQHSPSN